MKKNDVFEIEIEDIDINGNGIGKIDGFCFFVSGALPGEKIRAKAVKLKKSYGFAIIEEILTPSPHRRKPPCKSFKRCGGCTLQHLSYAAQLEWKTNNIQNCLQRIGGQNVPVLFTLPSSGELRYRNKAAFPMGMEDGLLKIGFYSMNSHQLVDIDDCLIQNKDIALLISQLKTWVVHNKISIYDETAKTGLLRHAVVRTVKNGDMMLTLCINGDGIPFRAELITCFQYVLPRLKSIILSINKQNDNTILGDKTVLVYGREYLTETIQGLDFKIGPHTFLQVNAPATDLLYSTLFRMLPINKKDTVVDLYCGAGTLTLPAAKRAKKVYGVEIVEESVKNARENASLNDIDNVEFIAGDVEKVLSNVLQKAGKINAIILDPPRKGLTESVIQSCASTGAAYIAYVSCNPSTLARDLALFAKLGYAAKTVQPVDMFPQTTHVETCVLLSHKNPQTSPPSL